MQSFFVLAQQEFTSAPYYFDAVFHKDPQGLFKRKTMGTAINQGKDVDTECALHLSAFIKRRQNCFHIRIFR